MSQYSESIEEHKQPKPIMGAFVTELRVRGTENPEDYFDTAAQLVVADQPEMALHVLSLLEQMKLRFAVEQVRIALVGEASTGPISDAIKSAGENIASKLGDTATR